MRMRTGIMSPDYLQEPKKPMQDSSKLIKISPLFFSLVCVLIPITAQSQSWRPDWNNSYYRPYQVPPYYNPYNGYTQPYPSAPNFYPYPYQQPQNPQQAQPESKEKTLTEPSNLEKRKSRFIQQILPIVQKENQRLIKLRYQVINLFILINRGYLLKPQDAELLESLATKYKVKGDPLTDSASRDELLNKIDIIPSSLALAQAANESAWGQSRFSREANNLFGIWTYDANKGLKPKERDEDKKHLVRKFKHIDDSIQYYMLTLNSHPAYRKMRKIRRQLREKNLPINGKAMAKGLEKYSSRGNEYVDLIESLIEQNNWSRFDTRV
jgi:Bax protein